MPSGRSDVLSTGFDQVYSVVHEALRWLDHQLRRAVAGYEGLQRDDLDSYAAQISIGMMTCQCECGGANCARQHTLQGRPTSGPGLEDHCRQAVLGPRTRKGSAARPGLRANAIVQGMAYPLLRREFGLHNVRVEWKRCPACGREYEGNTCVNPACRQPFDEQSTPVGGKAWLVLQTRYRPLRRWRCGGRADRQAEHFYPQRECYETELPELDEEGRPRHRVVHNREGDCQACSLSGCARHGTRHPQRGSELWVRIEWIAPDRVPLASQHVLSGLAEGVGEGMLQALGALPAETRDALRRAFGTDPRGIAEGLLTERPDLLAEEELGQVRQVIRAALEERGIATETVSAWLTCRARRPSEKEVRDNGWHDDDDQ